MQIKNNYDISWQRGIDQIGRGVFNGEIGTIQEIDDKNRCMQVKFDDDKICWYDFTELDQIEHSYSITIHKAQRK